MELLSYLVALLGVGFSGVALHRHLLINQPALSDPERGFTPFHNKWGRPVAGGVAVGAAVGLLAGLMTGLPLVTFIVGLLTLFLTVATITDIVTFRIPGELTNTLIFTMLVAALASLATGSEESFPTIYPELLPVLDFAFSWPLIALAGVVVVLSMAGVMVLPGKLAHMVMLVGYVALVLVVYLTVSGLGSLDSAGWAGDMFLPLLPVVLLVSLIGLLDLVAPNGIGGGDTGLLYAASLGLGWWMGMYPVMTAVLAGMLLQIILHSVAKPLGIGYSRETPNSPLKQAVANRAHKQATGSVEGAPTTYLAHAVPFVPLLSFGLVAGVLTWLLIAL